jgi:hypothetical protein
MMGWIRKIKLDEPVHGRLSVKAYICPPKVH